VDDLLQDIFIKIYKNLNNYNNSYKFSNWVYKISYNYVVDNYKKIKKRKINELSDEELKFENNDGNIISLLDIIEDKEQNIE
jgi:RNA polymerase sigma factor (sigma-70 family)